MCLFFQQLTDSYVVDTFPSAYINTLMKPWQTLFLH